jgi:hypothetical protein
MLLAGQAAVKVVAERIGAVAPAEHPTHENGVENIEPLLSFAETVMVFAFTPLITMVASPLELVVDELTPVI